MRKARAEGLIVRCRLVYMFHPSFFLVFSSFSNTHNLLLTRITQSGARNNVRPKLNFTLFVCSLSFLFYLFVYFFFVLFCFLFVLFLSWKELQVHTVQIIQHKPQIGCWSSTSEHFHRIGGRDVRNCNRKILVKDEKSKREITAKTSFTDHNFFVWWRGTSSIGNVVFFVHQSTGKSCLNSDPNNWQSMFNSHLLVDKILVFLPLYLRVPFGWCRYT